MLARSLVATLLSIPATVAVVGALLVIVPAYNSLIMSLLLIAFPIWVLIASAAFMIPTPARSAAALITVPLIGFGVIASVKYLGWTTL